LTLQISRPVQ